MRLFLYAVVGGLAVAGSAGAQAPESLQTILDRGHAWHWFVVGPFEPDAPGGISGALREQRPRLGEKDYLAPVGGLRRARPQEGLEVARDAGEAVAWGSVYRTGPMLDLAPLLEDRSEAVVFAAFYTVADRPRAVLLEVDSTLGARVAHNGRIVHDIANVPAADLDTQWVVLQLRGGANVIVFELPVAALEPIADASGSDVRTMAEAIRASRPMLSGESGAELGVRVHPVEQAGSLYVIPRLEPTGAFTGSVTSPRKEVALRVFNADTRTSQPVTATVTRLRGSVSLRRTLAAVPPGKVASVLFEVPMAGAAPGARETVQVRVVHGNAAMQFRTALLSEPPPTPGTVAYVLRPAIDDAEAYLPLYRANALLTGSVDEFGFNVGPGYLWRAGWARFPEVRETVSRAVLRGRAAAATGYAHPDARLTDETVWMRNLQIARAMSESFLADWSPADMLWDVPGMPWRFADVYRAAGGAGLVDNLPYPGRAPLEMLAGPGGTSVPVRHKREAVEAVSKPRLRDAARLHRIETTEAGLRTDVLVGEYGALPEPFWADDAVSLARSVPSVEVTGAGGRMLFESMALAESGGYMPPVARAPARVWLRPGELIAQPTIKSAYARTKTLLEQSETFATLAGIAGAPFPDRALDAAWRELLWASDAARLGFADDLETFVETLAALRRAANHAANVRDDALDVLARAADTYKEAPTRDEDVYALVVFNSASFPRTDVVQADVTLDRLAGFRLLDEAGRDVRYVADEVVIRNERIARMRFSFVARNVPAFGYRTYYVAPRARPVVWGDADGHTIENDRFELSVDAQRGGRISSLKWKETGQEFAPNGLNDVVSRTETAVQLDGGREIWADGGLARASAVEAVVRKRVGPGAERLEVRVPFGGGTLVRTLTLYEGVPRVLCTLELEGGAADTGLVGVTFPAPAPNPQALVGDGLGVRAVRVSFDDAPYRTQGTSHHGRAWEPADGMVYLGPGDAIRAERNMGYPLRPARIVLADEAFANAADELVRALASIGVPADLFDVRSRDAGAYTDAAPWTGTEQAEQTGEVLWIVLGDPQIAALGLAEAAPGTVGFFAEGAGAVQGPVLAVYGGEAETIETAAHTIADTLTRTGSFEPDAVEGAVELPGRGLAVYTRRAGLVTFDRDGATWLLAHEAGPEGWGDGMRSLKVEYAMEPVDGEWRARRVPQGAAAFAHPLQAHVTNLHLGKNPGEYSFLTVSGEGVLASGLRPASMHAAAASRVETHPRDGVVFNLAEVHGRRGEAVIRAGGLGFDAGIRNAAGTIVEELRINRGEFDVDLAPNGFELAGFRPAILQTIPQAPVETGPVTRLQWARPWEHSRPVLPEDGLPVTVEFREPPPGEASSVVLVIANNRSDAPVSGTVRIESSEGWAAGVQEIAYDIEPRAWHAETILLLRGHRPDTGFLVASTSVDGSEVVDVWPRAARFDAVAERRADEVQVKIENRSAVPLVGIVELIAAPDAWPEFGARPGVSPREYTLRVNPYETRRTLFTLPGGDWRGPLVVKVAVNGKVRYLRVVD